MAMFAGLDVGFKLTAVCVWMALAKPFGEERSSHAPRYTNRFAASPPEHMHPPCPTSPAGS
jgi:hypothetical protein